MSIQIKQTKSGYKQFWSEGKRLPSPSSICGRFKDSGGLLYWANQQGLEGRTLDDARDVAVAPGSITHAMVEADIRGHEFDRDHWQARIVTDKLDADDVWKKVASAYKAYQDWKAMTGLETVAAEVSLGSERHQFGGTLDAVAVQSGLYLLDWKTGSLYPDHILQLGGYVILWEENMDKPLDGCGLISINKDHGGFVHASWPRETMQIAVDQFLALRECYARDKQLKKLI